MVTCSLQRGSSLIKLPPAKFLGSSTIVRTAENGGLGLATLVRGQLMGLLSTEMGPDGDARWAHLKLIDLEPLLPVGSLKTPVLSGFAEGANVIFMSADDGTFTIKLESMRARKVCEMGKLKPVFPYVSFYTAAGTASRTSPCLFGIVICDRFARCIVIHLLGHECNSN